MPIKLLEGYSKFFLLYTGVWTLIQWSMRHKLVGSWLGLCISGCRNQQHILHILKNSYLSKCKSKKGYKISEFSIMLWFFLISEVHIPGIPAVIIYLILIGGVSCMVEITLIFVMFSWSIVFYINQSDVPQLNLSLGFQMDRPYSLSHRLYSLSVRPLPWISKSSSIAAMNICISFFFRKVLNEFVSIESCCFQTIPGLQFWSTFVQIQVYTRLLVFDTQKPCPTNLRHIEKYFWNDS